MPKDRSVRMLVAAVLFMLALFIAMSYLVEGRQLLDWWLPLGLFIIGLAVLLLNREQSDVAEETALVSPVQAYTVREYTFTEQPAAAESIAAESVSAGVAEVEPEPVEADVPAVVAEVEPEPVEADVPAVVAEVEPEPVEADVPAGVAEVEPEPVEAVSAAEEVVAESTDASESVSPETASDVDAEASEAAAPVMVEAVTDGDDVVEVADLASEQADHTLSEIPVEPLVVEKPEETQAERLEETGDLLQPADTAENEFQTGEHVAANQPTETAPPAPASDDAEAGEEGTEPLTPAVQEVLEATAAPEQPVEDSVDPATPEVAEAVLDGIESEAVDESLAPSSTIDPEPAGNTDPDDLTLVLGIGKRMQAALNAAGIYSFTRLSTASDEEIRGAIEAAGMRLAPTLSTWNEQASFLARGDKVGFEAFINAIRSEVHGSDTEE